MIKTIKRIIKLLILLAIICGIIIFVAKSDFISKYIGDKTNQKDVTKVDFKSNLKNIEFDLGLTDLNIIISNKFKITSNNDKLSYKEKDNTILIKEKDSVIKNGVKNKILNIYIPRKDYFNKMNIKIAAGSINIDKIKLKQFNSSVAAGSTEIGNIKVLKKANIIGGTGQINIRKGTINNLTIKSGVGSTNLSLNLKGDSNITTGVGGFKLKLLGNKEKYYFDINAGAGKFNLDGKEIKGQTTYGNGKDRLNITSGVGNLTIDFQDK